MSAPEAPSNAGVIDVRAHLQARLHRSKCEVAELQAQLDAERAGGCLLLAALAICGVMTAVAAAAFAHISHP